jgi:hypothetical protein
MFCNVHVCPSAPRLHAHPNFVGLVWRQVNDKLIFNLVRIVIQLVDAQLFPTIQVPNVRHLFLFTFQTFFQNVFPETIPTFYINAAPSHEIVELVSFHSSDLSLSNTIMTSCAIFIGSTKLNNRRGTTRKLQQLRKHTRPEQKINCSVGVWLTMDK